MLNIIAVRKREREIAAMRIFQRLRNIETESSD